MCWWPCCWRRRWCSVERKLPKNEAMENLQKPDWKPHSLDNEEELEFYEWLVVTTDGKEVKEGDGGEWRLAFAFA